MMLLVLLGLAAYYPTYVIVESQFPPVERFRVWALKRWGASWQWDLITCSWCVSAYTAAAVVGLAAQWYEVPMPVAVWLAVATFSGVMGLLVGVLDNLYVLQRRGMRDRGSS